MSRRWLLVLTVVTLATIVVTLSRSRLKERAPISGTHAGSASSVNSSIGSFPTGIAADSNGNIYIVAHKQNLILGISAARRVAVVAGNGSVGFSGDGGLADKASLDAPVSIALDSAGNLFIADTNNKRIRRVDAKTHIITTVAGNSTADGLNWPMSVAVDGDSNIYIGQSRAVGIKRVDAIIHTTTEIVGAGLPGASSAPVPAAGPFWVALDEHGTVFYSDPSRNSVSQVNSPENNVHAIAGNAVCGFGGDGGPASGALLCFPEALSVRGDKEVFIADTGNNRIRRVDLSTGIITTVAGNGLVGYAGDGGPAVNASLNGPMAIAVDNAGDLYIADTGNNCIRLLHAKTGTITTWASNHDLMSAILSNEGK